MLPLDNKKGEVKTSPEHIKLKRTFIVKLLGKHNRSV